MRGFMSTQISALHSWLAIAFQKSTLLNTAKNNVNHFYFILGLVIVAFVQYMYNNLFVLDILCLDISILRESH